MERKIRHISVQSNMHHYTKTLTIHIQHKILTILSVASIVYSSRNSRGINSKSMKFIVILRDNILKHINDWEMSRKVNSDRKIFVKDFSGTTASCMKPFLRKDPNHITLYAGTNNHTLDNTLQDIATSI